MPIALRGTGRTTTFESNTAESTSPSSPLTGSRATDGVSGFVRSTVFTTHTSVPVSFVTTDSKSGLPSASVSMSTYGTVLLPRLVQLPHVTSPNANIAFAGVRLATAVRAVDVTPTYRRSPAFAVSLTVHPAD